MDQTRFDAIARAIARPATRRRALGLALAGLVGGALRPSDGAAGPSCRPTGKHCLAQREWCAGSIYVAGWCQPVEPGGATACPSGT
jgi:hypothetical protein